MMPVLGSLVMLLGAAFCCLAALGLIRFPDLYTRLHAATKAGTLGLGLILLGAGLGSADAWVLVRSLVGLGFVMLVGPVSAHLLSKAARKSDAVPVSITSIDRFEDSP